MPRFPPSSLIESINRNAPILTISKMNANLTDQKIKPKVKFFTDFNENSIASDAA